MWITYFRNSLISMWDQKMVFIGFEKTPKGYSVAIYACPICNYREAYGQDTRTGEPRLDFYQHPD